MRAEGAAAELRKAMSAGRRISLLVRGSERKLTSVLKRVGGLREESRTRTGKNQVLVWLAGKEDKREALSKACVEAGLGLLELKGDQDGLEDLFVQLLQPDEGAAP